MVIVDSAGSRGPPQGALGIDLGCTNARVAVETGSGASIIPNPQGGRHTPCCVCYTDSECLAGEAAADAAAQPGQTVTELKRLMGRNFSDSAVQALRTRLPFRVVRSTDDHPYIQVQCEGRVQSLAPEEVCSAIVADLRRSAETHLGKGAEKAVLTVPVDFDTTQRRSVKAAAEQAGLEVLRVINEPTAACIAHGLDNCVPPEGDELYVLVVDLGGSTLQVSLLTIDEGIYEIRSAESNNDLGGRDFDERMVAYFVAEFERLHGKDLRQNRRALGKLRAACEQAKRALSSTPRAVVEVDALADGIDFRSTITRARFEELCGDLFRACLAPVDRALHNTRLQPAEVHKLVLAGGGANMPKLQRMLQDYFGGMELHTNFPPEEAVARGAAIQADILTRPQPAVHPCFPMMVALTIGIETAGGVLTPLAHRNGYIPLRKKLLCTTLHEYQGAVALRIFDGERAATADCRMLVEGTLRLRDPRPRGSVGIEVVADCDPDGVWTITVQEQPDGERVVLRPETRLTAAMIEETVRRAEAHREADRVFRDRHHAISCLEEYAIVGRRVIAAAPSGVLTAADAAEARAVCARALAWAGDMRRSGACEAADCFARRQQLETLLAPVARASLAAAAPGQKAGHCGGSIGQGDAEDFDPFEFVSQRPLPQLPRAGHAARLSHCGAELQNDDTPLADLGIGAEAQVDLSPMPAGVAEELAGAAAAPREGAAGCVPIYVRYLEEVFCAELPPDATVGALRREAVRLALLHRGGGGTPAAADAAALPPPEDTIPDAALLLRLVASGGPVIGEEVDGVGGSGGPAIEEVD